LLEIEPPPLDFDQVLDDIGHGLALDEHELRKATE